VDATPGSNTAICNFQLDIRDLKQLNQVVAELNKLKSVSSVERMKEPFNVRGKNRMREAIDIRH